MDSQSSNCGVSIFSIRRVAKVDEYKSGVCAVVQGNDKIGFVSVHAMGRFVIVLEGGGRDVKRYP